MSDNHECKPGVRPLYNWEIQEVRLVFGDTLGYDKVRVHECVAWPDLIDNIGRRLKGLGPKPANSHNAVTLGNHTYFPLKLPEKLIAAGEPDSFYMLWLIHELTHVWQYQHLGWRYLPMALWAQFRLKEKAYDFEGEKGLLKRREQGGDFHTFNLEQQGDITRSYYERVRTNQDISVWKPFIDDLQKSPKKRKPQR